MFSILRKDKRGALELSMNAIVIIVVAFVTLAAILGIGKVIFGKTTDIVPGVIDSSVLDTQPTANNPIVIPRELIITSGQTKLINIGLYNSGTGSVSDVKISVESCVNSSGIEINSATPAPSISAPTVDISSGNSVAISAIASAPGVDKGVYSCNFKAISSDNNFKLSKGIFITVSS